MVGSGQRRAENAKRPRRSLVGTPGHRTLTPGLAVWLVVAALSTTAPVPASAEDGSIARNLGVATCAGSTCHGAVVRNGTTNVEQNEYLIWESKDAHARAYRVLREESGRRIARNLGLPNAHEAELCLDCHTQNVPAELRAGRFRFDDGVGCEVCHGPSERWLGPHVAGTPDRAARERLIALGMTPTEDPIRRARLCQSCHVGDDRRFVNHRLYGAGHPRLGFELDTFTELQPRHYVVDEDYRRRKDVAGHVRVWSVGQAAGAAAYLRRLADPGTNVDGVFPELAFYDCQACHHPVTDVRWKSAGRDVPPGTPRLRDTSLTMLHVVAARATPDLALDLERAIRELHDASGLGAGAVRHAAAGALTTVEAIAARIADRAFGADDSRAVLKDVVERGSKGAWFDYSAAEQATMAIGAALSDLRSGGTLPPATLARLREGLERCYAALESEPDYRPADFTEAMTGIGPVAELR